MILKTRNVNNVFLEVESDFIKEDLYNKEQAIDFRIMLEEILEEVNHFIENVK